MNETNVIDLAIAFDENFLIPFYVLLTSVFHNNSNSRFHLHVVATGVTALEKEAITHYVEQKKGKISFYDVTASSLQGLVIPENRHYTLATYYRLFFPQLVPREVKKLLYLDTDVVVNGDLRHIYSADLGDFPAAAVAEINATKKRPDLGIHENGIYFNAGVLLMNLPAWKEQKVSERALQFIHDYPEKIRFADQDALNAILKGNYLRLEGKYNVIYQDVPKHWKTSQYRTFVKDKVIIHYSLVHKPWNAFGKNRLRFLYFTYLKLSPKAGSKKYTDFDLTPKNVLRFIKIRAKENLYNFPILVFILENLNF